MRKKLTPSRTRVVWRALKKGWNYPGPFWHVLLVIYMELFARDRIPQLIRRAEWEAKRRSEREPGDKI
jgi:hypothetical protein